MLGYVYVPSRREAALKCFIRKRKKENELRHRTLRFLRSAPGKETGWVP